MNKKLILLILVLPLILMISLFTTVNTVSLTVAVPVNGIDVFESETVYLDLDKGEKYFIEYAVYPTEASNQKVEFSTEAIGNSRLAELEYKDGYIYPQSVGQAKVILTTADGGFKDSLNVIVEANSLQAIECSVEESELLIGEKTTIFTEFVPRNAPNQQLKYEVAEGAEFVSVNSQGVVSGISVGVATIKVSSRINEEIYDTVQITVASSAPMLFTEKSITNTVQQNGGEIPLYIDSNADFDYDIQILNEDGSVADSIIEYSMDMENKRLSYSFLDETFVGDLIVKLTVTQAGQEPYADSCTIVRIREIEVVWENEESPIIMVGNTESFKFNVTPQNAEIEYRIELTNEKCHIQVTVNIEDGELEVKAVQAGENAKNSYTDIRLIIWDKDSPDNEKILTMRVNVLSDNFLS